MTPLRLSAILLFVAAPVVAQDKPELPPGGRYFEDSAYSVFEVTDRLFAIGEPTYYGNNFSYLLVGDDQALLLDGGASREDDMGAIVASLTDKPVAVIPSHLHYDHTGGIEIVDEVWLIDLPFTRGLADASGVTTLPVEVDLHDIDGLDPLSFEVDRYVAPDEVIDLGGLPLQVLWAGGHTRDEIVLWLPESDIMLSGDFVLWEVLFVGNLDDYIASADRLAGLVGEDTRLLAGHGDTGAFGLPELTRQDLIDTRDAFIAVREGRAEGIPIGENDYGVASGTQVPVNDKFYAWIDMTFVNGVSLAYD